MSNTEENLNEFDETVEETKNKNEDTKYESDLLKDKNIDIILIGLGANDMLRGISPNETEKNLEEIIIKILNKKIQIVIAGMIAPDSHGDDYKNEFDKIFKRLSIKYELDFIPFLLDGVALNPDLNLDDGMHPNEKGIIVISKNIEKKLLNILN